MKINFASFVFVAVAMITALFGNAKAAPDLVCPPEKCGKED